MVIYKYTKKEYLESFKRNGTILVNTLYYLRREKEEIKDGSEGKLEILIKPKNRPIRLSSTKMNYTYPNVHPTFNDPAAMTINKNATASSTISVADTFVFCASIKHSTTIQKRLGCDTYYRIIDKYGFVDTLCDALNNKYAIACYYIREVTYSGKPLIIENQEDVEKIQKQSFWRLCYTKDRCYSWQSEIRMVFPFVFPKKISHVILDVPELKRYCKF